LNLFSARSLTKNYFLSHYHSDHYGGLLSGWDTGTIYCSLPTANLVSQQLRVNRKFLHPLVMNQPTIIESRGKPVTVTCLDANHCPGAVMFFFEIGRKQILHVGDFRWSRDVMLHGPSSSPLQKIASQKMKLDELYLDTTYCNEKYALPSQATAIKATITMFENELERCKGNSSKRTLHLFGAYTIGKEKIYLSVAEHFGLKVYVDKSRYRILSALDLPKECMKLLTTSKEFASIWVVPMSHLNMKKMPEYFGIANSKPFAPAYDRIVGYRPTGWSITRSGIISSRNRGNLAIHSVPYSEHSSFPELVDCLACLKPAKIIPTVKASKSDEQVNVLLNGLRNRQTVLRLS
jgi:DNA cross-link repair 1A protein